MKYALDDKPSLVPMLLYGIQWWVISLPSAIILGTVVATIHELSPVAQGIYMQKIFLLMGLVSIVQVLVGHRLPLIIGPASTLLVGIAAASSSYEAMYTAILVGGALISVLAYSGILARLRGFFTTRVIAVILILIALALAPTILNLLVRESEHALFNLCFAAAMVFALIVLNASLHGLAKSTTLLWGIVGGTLAYNALLGLPLMPTLPPWQLPRPLFISHLEFDPGTILAFSFCFIALIINELGSVEAVGQMLGAKDMPQRNKRGIGILGLANMLCGGCGVIGFVDFSMSTGIISATRCASRYTLVPQGVLLMLCAMIPGVIGLLQSIPSAMMGALLLYVLSSQLSAGLEILVREKAVHNFNSGLIVGVPLMLALIVSNAPPETFSATGDLLRPIVANGFVMGLIAVLLLEHVFFKGEQ